MSFAKLCSSTAADRRQSPNWFCAAQRPDSTNATAFLPMTVSWLAWFVLCSFPVNINVYASSTTLVALN